MDPEMMKPGDVKLTGEDQLVALLHGPSLRLVIGDPDHRPLSEADTPWIGLPNPGSMYPVTQVSRIDLTDTKLDAWLAQGLAQVGMDDWMKRE